jgi:Fe-S oxidoreductase
VRVLEAAGWHVDIPAEPLCCGLTWISTGQLATAKRVLRRTSARLAEHVRAGGLVVGLEPSCTTVSAPTRPNYLPKTTMSRGCVTRPSRCPSYWSTTRPVGR